jgi:hypothetical protein
MPFAEAVTAEDLGVALNEANLLSVTCERTRHEVLLGLNVLSLPEEGAESDGRRVLHLQGVSRVVCSYRGGHWDDPDAPILTLTLEELDDVIADFGQVPVYGWEFVDVGDEHFSRWSDRLSLDETWAGSGMHTIDLFQDAADRILDIRIWFENLEVRDAGGAQVPLRAFVEGGRRWWNAMYAGDERASGHGIFPLRSDP